MQYSEQNKSVTSTDQYIDSIKLTSLKVAGKNKLKDSFCNSKWKQSKID